MSIERVNQIVSIVGDYLNLISIIIGLVIGIVAIYYKIRNNIIQCATQFIALIEEDTNLTGPEKWIW